MTLTLQLSVSRPRVQLGGEIVTHLTLTNSGTDRIETASLFDNNRVTNILLSNERDEPIGTYNHITRQLLFEKTEPRTDDVRLLHLAPGATEVRNLNFCTWHWIEQPGVYFLRGLYMWDGKEVYSAPRRIEILPTSLVSLDYQWAYHYGAQFLLNSTWVVKGEDGVFEVYLRESTRFRPQVINHNPIVHSSPSPLAPRVSFNSSLIVGGGTWVAWIDRNEIVGIRTNAGEVDLGPLRFSAGLGQLQWVGAPLTSTLGDVHLFCSGLDSDQKRVVVGLSVDENGILRERQVLSQDFSSAITLIGVSDQDGHYFLLWHTLHNVYCWEIDLATQQPLGQPTHLWRSQYAICGLLTPPVLEEEWLFSCVYACPDPGVLGVVWLQANTHSVSGPVKTEELPFPSAGSIVSCDGTMNGKGDVFVLLRSKQGVYYVNPTLMQTMSVVASSALRNITHERLIVTPRHDVFCAGNMAGIGLSEWLLHTGDEQDLDDDDDDDDE